MNNKESIELDKKYLMQNYGARFPVTFERGEGCYLYDVEGNKYCDFMSGIAVNLLGHNNKILTEALHKQVDKLLHTSNLYHVKNQELLAQKIVENSCADRIFFSNSGAEANEGAIKLARIKAYKEGKTDKFQIITLINSFHGRTLATIAATGQEKYRKPYRPLTPDFKSVEINDFEALEKEVNEKTCAIMLELIQGESGVRPVDAEYLAKVRKLCDDKDIVLIFDEVQTGMGRSGEYFAYKNYGIEPDIFTLAKALGGGVPIGAVCAKEEFAVFEAGDHGSTFGGNPLATAAGLAVFDAIEKERILENTREMGEYFANELRKIGKIKEVRGLGLMLGAEFETPAAEVNMKLFEKGYLCGAVGNTLRILPPLIINKEIIDNFVVALKEVLG